MRTVEVTNQFRRDTDRLRKQGRDRSRIERIVEHIAAHGQAPAHARPHKLSGEWDGSWECHIMFDWLLIYTIEPTRLILRRTGTHEDLFG